MSWFHGTTSRQSSHEAVMGAMVEMVAKVAKAETEEEAVMEAMAVTVAMAQRAIPVPGGQKDKTLPDTAPQVRADAAAEVMTEVMAATVVTVVPRDQAGMVAEV